MRTSAVAFAWLAIAASMASAQGAPGAAKECAVHMIGVVVNGVPTTTTQINGKGDTTWMGGGVDARCEGTDQRILADSAEQYSGKKLLILIGHVHYTETRMKLDTDRLTYYTGEERLLAEGNVVGTTNTGTTFRGPHVVYLRPAAGIRLKSHMVAEPRASIWVSPKDAGGSTDSVNIQADHIVTDNDSLVYAKGLVVIERPDLLSTSDSAFMDNGTNFARLTQTPKVIGRGERHFQLEGDIIDIYSNKKREVEKVKSLGHATAVGDDAKITADTIDLRVNDQKLERAYAWGKSRAKAHMKDEDIFADSIDTMMPNQELREMRALGNAVAESDPDTSKMVTKKKDFLRGEIIIATFDSAATADTSKQAAIKQVFARGKPASSLYHVAPAGVGKTSTPNENYTRGDSVIVDFINRKVHSVRVLGHADGMYLEAVDTTKKAKTDSSATKNGKDGKPVKKPAEIKKP